MFNHRKIQTRLYGLIAFVSLLLIATAFIGLRSAAQSDAALDTVYSDRVVPLKQLKVISDMYGVNIVDTSHKVRNGTMTLNEGQKKVAEATATITEQWQAYLATYLVPEEKRLVAEVVPLMKTADRAIAKLSDIMKKGDRDALIAFTTFELYPAIEPISKKLNNLVAVQLIVTKAEHDKSTRMYHQSRTYSSALILFGMLLAIVLGMMIVRSITIPLAAGAAAADKLLIFTNLLEQKNGELADALARAEQATTLKGEFLANMSHEIRTPLSAIFGYSELALKTDLPPRQRKYVQRISTAGESLLHIVNDILDFSKIEAGKLDMEQTPFRLENMLAETFSLMENKAQEKGILLKVETLPDDIPVLSGDPHRLTQIIVNLLNNAVKFTPQGEVVLHTELLAREKERIQLKFTVRDTGIGIPTEQIDKLFQPFTQAENSTTRRFGGTGLGLSISKQLVELMGGTIWCESLPGQGSVFCFTAWFDIEPADGMEQCTLAESSNDKRGESFLDFSAACILLVDDNEINRRLALEFLKDSGAVVHIAENGKEAVTMIREGSTAYDLVLMDISMPVMDGYEAVRLIRKENRFALLPVIAMTAHTMKEEQQKIMQAGFNAFIGKPMSSRTMLNTIAKVLFKQEAEVPLYENSKTLSANESFIPEIDGLDSSAALENLDGNRKLYVWALQAFVENESNTAIIIEEALDAGDTNLAARRAHTIISSAGYIGAVELEELAQILETAIALGEPPASISVALERFAAEVAQLTADIRKYLPVVPDIGMANLEVAERGNRGMLSHI